MDLFELTAKVLDTLPDEGRVLVLAVLLSIAFAGVNRGLRSHPSLMLRVLFLRASLMALGLVPLLVYAIGLKMPVYVEQATQFGVTWPTIHTGKGDG